MPTNHAASPLRQAEDPRDQAVMDLDHLDGFTAGDRQLEGELAALFLSTAEVYVGRMSQALTSGESWTGPAHALKGASANLGARRLAVLARLAEQSEPDATTLDEVRRALDEVRDFFEARQP
jgi:HPt (histidine-containing phosphotransfer) domain-containing protein